MCLDYSTSCLLELTKGAFDGIKKSNLFDLMNKTHTSGGATLLRSCLLQPLTDEIKINENLDFVA
ncbi:hypothetical protein MXB_3129, partial [Myxobolus squamalis]